MAHKSFERLGKHTLVYGISNTLGASVSLFLLPLLTRYLTPSEYGVLEVLTVFAAQLGVLLQLGLGSALFKSVLHTDGANLTRWTATAYYTIAASGAAVAAIVLSFSPEIARLVLGSDEHETAIRWIAVKALFDGLSVVPLARLRMREASVTYGILNVGRLVVTLAFVLVTLLVFDGALNGVVMALAAESILFAAITAIFIAAELKPSVSREQLSVLLRFGAPLIPFAFGLTILAHGDRYLLRLFGDLAQVGQYAVGAKVAAILGVAVRAFQVAWPPVLFTTARTPNGRIFFAKTLTYILLALGFAAVAVTAFARELVHVLASSAFRPGVAVVPVLVFAQMSLGAFYATAVGTNVAGKTTLQVLSIAFATAAFGATGFLLVPRVGMIGAACATVVGYLTLAVANGAFSVRLYPVRYEWGRVAGALTLTVLMVAAGSFVRIGHTWADAALRLVIITAFPTLAYLKILDSTERQAIRLRVLRLLSRLLLPAPTAPFDATRVRRVLIYGGMGIGNLVMFTPALRALRSTLADAHLTLLTLPNGADEVLKGSGIVDEIVCVPTGLWGRLRLALRLRRAGYDLVLASFQGDDFKLITLLTNVSWRVGHCTSPGWIGRGDSLYNVPVRMDEHEIDRKLRLVRALGVPVDGWTAVFHIDNQDRFGARAFLERHGVRDEDRLIAIPIDVSRHQEWKQWQPDRLAAVCNMLNRRGDVRFVLMGAPDRTATASSFRAMLDFEPIVAVARTTLKETAAILERCALTISPDSGLMHVSAAVGTAVLGIFGPTDYRRTSPTRYGPRHRIVRKEVECGPCFRMAGDDTVLACRHHKCLDLIRAHEVAHIADEMLDSAVSLDVDSELECQS